MTSLLILIKHRFPWIWRAVESVNGWLFSLLHPRFAETVSAVLDGCDNGVFRFSAVDEGEAEALSEFLCRMPASRVEHFAPHAFDADTLRRLCSNPSFAMMKVVHIADGSIAGYFFLRCFFIGRAFHGLVVGEEYSGRGLGTQMWSLSSRICAGSDLRMFATVSRSNAASLASARRGTDVAVVEELANGYLLIECTTKQLYD